MLKSLATTLRPFVAEDDGPTTVEYAVMLSLIVIVCLAAVWQIGTNASSVFQDAANSLHSPGGGAAASAVGH